MNDKAKERNGNLPGMGGVFNSINLDGYHYAGDNPVKMTDPDGNWGENVHRQDTKKWALGSGFSEQDAKTISEADAYIDEIASHKNYLPALGDQGYHFNTNAGTGKMDSRILRARNHMANAIKYQKRANQLYKLAYGDTSHPAYKQGQYYDKLAKKELGYGSHALQDIKAHSAELTKKDVIFGVDFFYHDSPEYNNKPNLADSKSFRPERYKDTESLTKGYYKIFFDSTRE